MSNKTASESRYFSETKDQVLYCFKVNDHKDSKTYKVKSSEILGIEQVILRTKDGEFGLTNPEMIQYIPKL